MEDRMVKARTGRMRLTRWVLGLLALAFAVSALAVGPAGSASAAPTPVPTPAQTAAAYPQSIGIWVRLASDKSNVAGVSVLITGPKGFSQTVTTDKGGRALVGVPYVGDYKVKIDVASTPGGKLYPTTGVAPRIVAVDKGDPGIPAFFLLSPTIPNPSSGGSGGSGGSNQPTTSPSLGDLIFPRLATGLIFGLLIALASVGVSLIYGTTGLNNFAHGELVTFGALVGYTVSGLWGMPGWLGILLAVLLGGAFGWVQDLGLWKPLRKRRIALIPLMIVSIGLSLAVRYIFQIAYGPDLLVTPSDSSSFLNLGPVHLRFTDVTSPIIAIVVLLVVAYVMLRTRIGKATRAVADNGALASASGINVERVIRFVWVLGGALAGLSGALIGYYQPVSWQTGASVLLLIFASVTLGGLGTAFGALVGSLIISVLVDESTIVIPSNMKLVAALLVMIIILIFRPQGILGRRDRIG
jgi:branched-subunit amino acid ABC-type transport system permease component